MGGGEKKKTTEKSVFAHGGTFLSTLAVEMHKVYKQRQKGLKV